MHTANPGAREAHRALARHMTTLLHGQEQTDLAENAAKALFSGEVAGLPLATLREALAGAPATEQPMSLVTQRTPLVDFLVTIGLASSKRESREFLANGSVSVSGVKATPESTLTEAAVLHGVLTPIRRGKKNWMVVTWNTSL